MWSFVQSNVENGNPPEYTTTTDGVLRFDKVCVYKPDGTLLIKVRRLVWVFSLPTSSGCASLLACATPNKRGCMLQDLTFSLTPGQRVIVTGDNGCGCDDCGCYIVAFIAFSCLLLAASLPCFACCEACGRLSAAALLHRATRMCALAQ